MTQFTNCHLEKSGLQTYECTEDMSVAACTRPMVDSTNSLAYNAYTQFFTHAESMCFYLQSAAFQAATEHAVDALHASARGTAEKLGELQTHTGALVDDTRAIRAEQAAAAEAATELLTNQKAASSQLQSLSSEQAMAFEKAESSLAQLGGESKAALETLRRGTEEIGRKQGTLLGGLDKVLSLQGSVLGEFLDMKSVFFYTCAVLLALALTATKPTAAARLPIFALLTINLLAEKMLAVLLVSPVDSPEAFHGWTSLARRFTMSLGLAILAYAALHHTDVGKRTLADLAELKEMQKQASEELQARLERLEREAAALRSREATRMVLQAQSNRKLARRSTSPIDGVPMSGKAMRRAISPLAPGTAGGQRHGRSPSKSAAAAQEVVRPPPASVSPTPTDSTTTEATAFGGVVAFGAKPPSPLESAAESAAESEAVPCRRPSLTSLSNIAAGVAAGVSAAADAVGATPAARARRRRSSMGPPSNETDCSQATPTRRSARLASKMQQRVVEEAM